MKMAFRSNRFSILRRYPPYRAAWLGSSRVHAMLRQDNRT